MRIDRNAGTALRSSLTKHTIDHFDGVSLLGLLEGSEPDGVPAPEVPGVSEEVPELPGIVVELLGIEELLGLEEDVPDELLP